MTKLIVILGFALSFGAGMVVGIGTQRASAPPPPATRPHGGPAGWLAAQLKLTPEQQQQLNKIWSEIAHRGGREQDERRRQLRRERDDAITALIRSEDRAAYDDILKNYDQQKSALDREWRAGFERAVEETMKILTPEQRARYEEIRKQRQQWERGPGGSSASPGRPGVGDSGGPGRGKAPRNNEQGRLGPGTEP